MGHERNADLYTQFGETAIPGKDRLMVRTIQAGSLCYIAFRSVERSLEDILALFPRTHGSHATAQSSIGFQPVFCSHRRALLFQRIDSGAGRPLPPDKLYKDQGFNPRNHPPQRHALKGRQRIAVNGTHFALQERDDVRHRRAAKWMTITFSLHVLS